jgi:hypothetical protein
VTEGWINIDGTNNAVRLSLTQVSSMRGVGVGQLYFTFEATAQSDVAIGLPLWLGGALRITSLGAAGGHLTTLDAGQQPAILPDKGYRTITLTADLDYRQFQLIEEARVDGVTFVLDLNGYWLRDGNAAPCSVGYLEHKVGQSDWIALLENVGYRRVLLVEFDRPDAQASPALAAAFTYFDQAEKHYLNGEWRNTVESLRQSLAALVGKKPDDEDQETDILTAVKDLRKEANKMTVAYQPRYEMARRTLKYLCDLGAHPEVAETRKVHAHSALFMVGGVLLGWDSQASRQPGS